MSSPKSKPTLQLNMSAELVNNEVSKRPMENAPDDHRSTITDDPNGRPNLATILNILTVLLEKSNKSAVHETQICKSVKIICPKWKATDVEVEQHIRTMLEEGQLRYECFYDGDGSWKIRRTIHSSNETIYNLAQSLAQTLYTMADTLAQKSEVESQKHQVTKEELSNNMKDQQQPNNGRIVDNKGPSVHDSVVFVVSSESRSSIWDDGETRSERIHSRFTRNRLSAENSKEKVDAGNRPKIYLCSHCNEKFARQRLCRKGLSRREIVILIHELLRRDEEKSGGKHCFCNTCLGTANEKMKDSTVRCCLVQDDPQQNKNVCENNVKMIAEYLSKKHKR